MSLEQAATLQAILETTVTIETDDARHAHKGHKGHKGPKDLPAFSLPGSGFMGIYSLGAVTKLAELKILQRTSHIYGASAGSIIAGAFCAGADMKTVKEVQYKTDLYCAEQADLCYGELATILQQDFDAVFKTIKPKEIRKNCVNTFISVSNSTGTCNITAGNYGANGGYEFYSAVQSKADLANLMIGSSYIPGFTGDSCYWDLFNGMKAIDGGFAANKFCLSSSCVTIYPYPTSKALTADIYPGVRGIASLASWPLTTTEWSVASRRPDIVAPVFDQIFDFGAKDAAYWAETIYHEKA